jgi:hypothetical protein
MWDFRAVTRLRNALIHQRRSAPTLLKRQPFHASQYSTDAILREFGFKLIGRYSAFRVVSDWSVGRKVPNAEKIQ